MTIMTNDRERPSSQSKNNNPFGLNDEEMKELLEESKKAGEHVRRVREEQEKYYRELTLYCPYDGSPSKFIGYKESYTIVKPFYRCEQGHEFPHSQGRTFPSGKSDK